MRASRFVLFAVFTVSAIAPSAPAIRDCLCVASQPWSDAPGALPLAASMALLAAVFAFAVALCAATFGAWRAPLAIHLVPIAIIGATLLFGPLRPVRTVTAGDGRAIAAMVEAARRLESGESIARLGPSGFRRFGIERDFTVLQANEPGAVHLRRSEAGRFTLSAVVLGDDGRPRLARDGVGKDAVVEGQVRP